jgi:serine/threonine protein kinase
MTARVCPKCQQTVDGDDPFCPRDGTRLLKRSVYAQIAASTDPLVGQRVAGRYLVIRKLGEGGMGDVFLAEHEDIEKRLALKVLKYEYSSRPDVVVRFKQEAVSASRIKHPNVVDVFDFGQVDDGRFYLAMELLEGRDLADVLAAETVVPPRRAVRIALQVCRALAAAHAKGVVHRDMKPENVFLTMTADGEEIVKIVDFGIAKIRDLGTGASVDRRRLTKTGMVFGTPEYMAPEQAAGREIDHKVDVYATGVILYEMLAGRVPFWGETFMAVLTAHLTAQPPDMRSLHPSLQISPELERAVYQALEKEPSRRFDSMAALTDALGATPEANLDIPIPLARPTGREVAEKRAGRGDDQLARASTQPELATAPTEPLARVPARERGRVKTLGVLAAFGLLASFGAVVGGWRWWAARLPAPGLAQETATAMPSSGFADAAASAPEPVSTSRPSVVVSSEPEPSILIHVETRPAGAVVKKREGESWFQVCATSPCDYPARRDERLELLAELGAMRGTGSVLARTPQTVTITLAAARSVAGTAASTGGKRTDQCEFCVPRGDPDCIKVLRPCNQPP